MRVLELGCGDVARPEPDWDYLDMRPLPCVTFIQSAVDLSNLDPASYDRVVAVDLVEHLSWWDVPKALHEWFRVLVPGGVLEIETPNALELVELIQRPAHYGLMRWGAESDWQRFSRVAYGHQDYAENTHRCYFTPEWLTGLLFEAGASSVSTVDLSLQRFRLEATK